MQVVTRACVSFLWYAEHIRAQQASAREDQPAEIIDAHLHVAVMEAKHIAGMESFEGIQLYCTVHVLGPHVNFEDRTREERSQSNTLRWCDEFVVKRIEQDAELCIVVHEVSVPPEGEEGADGADDGTKVGKSMGAPPQDGAAYGFEGGRRRKVLPADKEDAGKGRKSDKDAGGAGSEGKANSSREVGRVRMSIRKLYADMQKQSKNAEKGTGAKVVDGGLDGGLDMGQMGSIKGEDKWFDLFAMDSVQDSMMQESGLLEYVQEPQAHSPTHQKKGVGFGHSPTGSVKERALTTARNHHAPQTPNSNSNSTKATDSSSPHMPSNPHAGDGRSSVGKLRLIVSFGPRDSGHEYEDVDQYVTRGILRDILQQDDLRNRQIAQHKAMDTAAAPMKARVPSMLSLPKAVVKSGINAVLYVPRTIYSSAAGLARMMTSSSMIPVHMFAAPPPLPETGGLRSVFGGYALQRPLLAVKKSGVGQYSRETPLRELGGMQQDLVGYGNAVVERIYEKAGEKERREEAVFDKKMLHIQAAQEGGDNKGGGGAGSPTHASAPLNTPVPGDFQITPFVNKGFVPPPVRPPTPVHARRTDGGFA
jgi:hypothetical protein